MKLRKYEQEAFSTIVTNLFHTWLLHPNIEPERLFPNIRKVILWNYYVYTLQIECSNWKYFQSWNITCQNQHCWNLGVSNLFGTLNALAIQNKFWKESNSSQNGNILKIKMFIFIFDYEFCSKNWERFVLRIILFLKLKSPFSLPECFDQTRAADSRGEDACQASSRRCDWQNAYHGKSVSCEKDWLRICCIYLIWFPLPTCAFIHCIIGHTRSIVTGLAWAPLNVDCLFLITSINSYTQLLQPTHSNCNHTAIAIYTQLLQSTLKSLLCTQLLQSTFRLLRALFTHSYCNQRFDS